MRCHEWLDAELFGDAGAVKDWAPTQAPDGWLRILSADSLRSSAGGLVALALTALRSN